MWTLGHINAKPETVQRSTKESLMFTVERKVEETMFLETSHTKVGLKSTVEVVENPKEIDRGEVGEIVFKDSSRSGCSTGYDPNR